jgi:D-glutamate cyclase
MGDHDLAFAEQTARNIDRVVTVLPVWGGRMDGWLAPQLYESASEKVGGKPLSLVAAQAIVDAVGKGDRVILVDHFAFQPVQPWGETDGPPGVASLARAISFGLRAIPVLVTGPKDIRVARETTQAAGVGVFDYDQAVRSHSSLFGAGEITFPIVGDVESKDVAIGILERVAPKAVISVETIGPNSKGVRHRGGGLDAEVDDEMPHLEHLFLEARARGILTIAMIDRGNEIGGGSISDAVARIVPYGDKCRCPCEAGICCAVETDIVFPAAMSNWGAYAISAMLAYLTAKPEALQDDDTERRMLEACVMAGAIDGTFGKPILAVDGSDLKCQQAVVNLLGTIVVNALRGRLTSDRPVSGL